MTGKKSKTTAGPEDDDLWQRVTAGVKPLCGRKKAVTADVAAIKRTKPPCVSPAIIKLPPNPPAPGGDAPPAADWRTARRLKKGKTSIEARVDLHGMTQHQAHGALADFIAKSYDSGRRCVLVITGKGRGGLSAGVLRSGVPRWLNQSPNREKIISLTQAASRDGGDGALYVLLKKKR
ncbi:MAG: hypothetical protein A3G18_00065 [Rhodospirillales bacterium RIFCSPLOWO2_12_FULL_58_28]|nr:MAG: hypothetical protein A3H92_02675 [Rhodospirillales bacterium RIFCSPLOWO2_02_FULL_58_16]OHC79864.1 MAG: hypothetical protein A3G18_00065 [Rhodospirillales bacterium RIFCSPLOWO2_12_FULL_58_28]